MKRSLVSIIGSVVLLFLLTTAGMPFVSNSTADWKSIADSTLPHRQENVIVVTSTADSGPGTLRQALLDAQSGDSITFDPTVFPPVAPVTIALTSALPDISQGNQTVDASNAGVILDGGNIPADWTAGLQINSDGNIVQGLQIINFSGPGIALPSGAHGNMIGGDQNMGAGLLGQGNLISACRNVGVYLSDASFNVIRGNYIGTDPIGAAVWGNRFDAVLFDGSSSHNQVIDNLISGNHLSGIEIRENAIDNIVGPNNVITLNDENGIQIVGPNALRNTITQNSIYDNGEGGGIDLQNGGNTELDVPVIPEWDLNAGTVRGWACANCVVEIFSSRSYEGEVYEGQTTSETTGAFTFNRGASFTDRYLTATATDADGNTSEFSAPTPGTTKSPILQEGNNLPYTLITNKQSSKLEDNRIGGMAGGLTGGGWQPGDPWDYVEMSNQVAGLGLKRFRVSINNLDYHNVDWNMPEMTIDPSHDALFTLLAENDVTLTYVLTFWDKATWPGGEGANCPRFKDEDEIQRYLDFVRFMVHNLKDRIQYYEIWNEPNLRFCPQWIEIAEYINIVKRVVPVIRQEYPGAKIVVGGTTYLGEPDSQDYLFSILESDIMPLVDVVSWHPMYGTSPEFDSEYYYEYPSIMQEIKNVASAHGFEGDYEADELTWFTLDGEFWDGWSRRCSDTIAAKYQARGIIMHLGTNVTAGIGSALIFDTNWVLIPSTVQNLCSVMTGHEPAILSIQVQSTITNTVSYTFSMPKENYLIALWNDGVAVDADPGTPATLTIPGYAGYAATGIDVLHGFQQQLLTSEEDGDLIIRDLLVKDYPIILRLYEPKYLFLPSIQGGVDVSEGDK